MCVNEPHQGRKKISKQNILYISQTDIQYDVELKIMASFVGQLKISINFHWTVEAIIVWWQYQHHSFA